MGWVPEGTTSPHWSRGTHLAAREAGEGGFLHAQEGEGGQMSLSPCPSRSSLSPVSDSQGFTARHLLLRDRGHSREGQNPNTVGLQNQTPTSGGLQHREHQIKIQVQQKMSRYKVCW